MSNQGSTAGPPPSEATRLRSARWALRDLGRRDGVPVILLHGLGMTADSCWSPTYGQLSQTHRVISFDLRGHGEGGDVSGKFSLEECADDAAQLAHELGLGRCVVIGYSLGGLVAQMMWKRSPSAVGGLVLCATAHYPLSPFEWGLRITPTIGEQWRRGMSAKVVRNAELWVLASAMQAAARFDSRRWIGAVDAPTAIIVTTRDAIILPWRQRHLAQAIGAESVHNLRSGHLAPLRHPQRFADAIAAACAAVAAVPR
ncbi:MAG TPA: alpha/beta hydrolase [Acidimicrobiales bacterium]|nr:alpha/beta hydrolase [Acidimicrobiales bacterium]